MTWDDMPLILTADELAAVLRKTRKAVYVMAEWQLPGVVGIGRRMLFRRDDLLDWLRQ